jgi:SlyX protein
MQEMEQKLMDLEVRYTHQQAWIDDLNQVVREQGDVITAIREELERLRENIKQGVSNEKPPHY